MTDRQGESGNIFFTLFGAIALIGIIGVATATLMRGPVGTVVALNMRTKVDTQLQIARKLAALDALNQANGGDCDNDGYVEPSPPDVASQGCATLIAGGGCLPTSIGAARTDPWGTLVGYCGWNHGSTTSGGNCSSDLRVGTNANSKTVIAIISAGPDRVFQTQCKDDPDYVVTAHGSDDIVESWTFEEAQTLAGGGLWVLQSGNPNAITTTKQVDISKNSTFASGTTATFQGSAAFNAGSQLNLSNGGLFLLPDDTKLTTCNVANNGLLRRFTQNGKQLLQICNGAAEKPVWINVGGAGDDLYIDQLADAVSDITAGANLFLGNNGGNLISGAAQNVAVGVNAGQNVTSGKNNVLLGYNAGSSLSVEHDDILLGDNVQAPAGKSHYISIGNLIYGDTALGRIGINNPAPGSALDVNGDIRASGGGAFNGGVSGSDGSFSGNLSAGGTSTLTGAIDAQGGIANSTGDLNLNDNVDISGTASIGSTLTANGNTTVGGTLGVGGNTALGGNLTVMGNAIMSGGLAAPAYELGVTGSGIGLYSDSAGGLQLATGAAKRIEVTADGKVGIGVATPAAPLDVGGAIKVGQDNAAICGAAMYGAIRYSSAGDHLQQCSSTNKWVTLGGGGGGGGTAAGTYWTQNSNGTLYYLAGDVGIGTSSPLAPLDVAGELSVTGGFTGTAVTPYTGAGSRMFFDPASGAFRAGVVSGPQWNSGSIGTYSAAFGDNDTASGTGSFAAGTSVTASGIGGIGLGTGVQAQGAGSTALGSNVVASGDHSFAFGLTGATGTSFASVSGTDSLGIFMQDQHNVVLAPNNTMALLGGQMIIDPASPATMLSLPNNTIGLGVNAGIAATQFCDTDGTHCFTADDVSGGLTGAPGADTDIIYNSGGKLGADGNLSWDRTNNRLNVGSSSQYSDIGVHGSLFLNDGVVQFTPNASGYGFQFVRPNSGNIFPIFSFTSSDTTGTWNLLVPANSSTLQLVSANGGGIAESWALNSGDVGIGTGAAATKLDVAGTLKIADGGETCNPTYAGGIRYIGGILQYCDGTAWETLSSTAAGGNPWSSLTNPAANLSLSMGAYTTTWTAGAATAGNVFTMQDTAGNSGTGYLLNVATAAGSALNPFHVGAAGIDAMTVLANGNVGIGTATPATKLYVAGTVRIGNGNEACNATVAGGIRYISGLVQYCDSTAWQTISSTSGAGGVAAAGNTGDIQFNNAGVLGADIANLFWDNANKRVGIGTVTPTSALEVQSHATGAVQTIAARSNPGNAGSGYLNSIVLDNLYGAGNMKNQISLFSAGVEKWDIGNDYAGNGSQNFYIYDGAAGAPRLFIDASGNTGIGTVTPGAPLDVYAGTANALTTGVQITGGSGGTTSGTSVVFKSAFTGGSWLMGQVGAVASGWGTSYGGDLVFETNADTSGSQPGDLTEKMRITSAGLVGIGTAAPAAMLDVHGNARLGDDQAQYLTFAGSAAAPVIGTAGTANNIDLSFQTKGIGQFLFGGGGWAYTTASSGAGSLFLSNGTDDTPNIKFAYANDKNFGMDSAPSGLFGNQSGQILRFIKDSDESAGSVIGAFDAAGNFAALGTGLFGGNALINGAGDSYFNGGNVGIGTTTPQTKLDVVGTIRVADGNETCGSAVAGGIRYTAGDLQYCDGTAWQTISSTSGTGGVAAAGSTGQVQFNNGGVLGADANYFWDNTNKRLGIGTAAPVSPLHVARANGPVLTMQELGGTYYDGTLRFTNASGALGAEWGVSEHLANSLFEVSSAAGVPQLTISLAGRVGLGLGTTAATAGLDVQVPVTAASGAAYATRLKQTLTATANNDVLYGLYINPTYAPGSFTGVTNYDLAFAGGANRILAVLNNASSAGNSLTVQAGGTNGGTNIAGGNLILSAGQASGNAGASIVFNTPVIGASGSAVQASAETARFIGANFGLGTSNPKTWSGVTVGDGVNQQIYASTGNARLVINSNSGNAELHLVDDASASGHRNFRLIDNAGVLTLDQPADNYSTSQQLETWLNNGNAGFGSYTPATKVDIAGTLRVANGGETCGSTIAGGIRYTAGILQYCDSTAWQTISSTSTTGGNPWSSLTSPTANLALSMGAYTTTWTAGAATTGNVFTMTDTAGNTGTGYLLDLATATGSTLKPLLVTAGSVNSIYVNQYGGVGFGGAPQGDVFQVALSMSAQSGAAYGTVLKQTLTATANNDTLYGLYINPTYTPGSYTGVTNYDLAFSGSAARTIAVMGNGANTGSGLTVQAGGTAGSTDKSGGDLTLSAGQSTGAAGSNIIFKAAIAGTSGTAANAPTEIMRVASNGFVGVGTASPIRPLTVNSELSLIKQSGNNTAFLNVSDATGNSASNLDIRSLSSNGSAEASLNLLTLNAITTSIVGNTGAGTSSPQTRLDVAGTLKVANGGETCTSTVAGGIRYTAGALQYCDSTAWQTISSTSSAGGNPWSSLTAPTANLALAMGGYTTTFTYGAATSGNQFTLQDTASDTGTGYLLNVATASGSTLKPFHVGAAGADALTVLANGYVGVGTAAPSQQLTISSGGQAAWDNGSGTADVGLKRASTGILQITNGSSGTGKIWSDYGSYTAPAYSFASQTNSGMYGKTGFADFAFTSGGVSIWSMWTGGAFTRGDTYIGWSDNTSGDIIGSATNTRLFRDANGIVAQRNSTNAQIFRVYNTYTSNTNYERGVIDWATTANVLSIGTEAAGSGVLRNIDLIGGNVGVGVTAPLAALDIQRGETASSGAAYGTRLQQTLTAAANNDTLYGLYINPTFTPGSFTGVKDYDLAFSGSAARTIAVMGNGSSTGSGLTVKAGDTSGGTDIAGGNLTLSGGQGTGAAGSNIIFKTSVAGGSGTTGNVPAEAMRIASNGYVGIGTSSPQRALNVQSATTFQLVLENDGSNGGFWAIGQTSDAFLSGGNKLEFVPSSFTSTGASVVFTQDGKAGFGTISPATRLDVAGTARVADGGETCGSTIAGGIRFTAATLQYCDGTAWQTVSSTSGTGGVAAAGSTGDVQFNNGGVLGADNTNFFWDNTNKRLGIGTATPAYTFQVVGPENNSTPDMVVGASAAGNVSGWLGFSGSRGGFGACAGCLGGGAMVMEGGSGKGLDFYVNNSTGSLIGGTEALDILISGYVGIGTSAPVAALDVLRGNTAASGAAYGTRLQQTLTAAANNDTLYGLYISPTYTPGSYTGVTDYDLAFAGGANRTEAVLNNASTAGNSFTIQAGGTKGGTDIAGGDLILNAGQSTGAAESKIVFEGPLIGASGTTIHAPAEVGRVTGGGFVQFAGTYGSGDTMAQAVGTATPGAGTRMVWYPRKAAFRAGGVSGTAWDDANVGTYSVALGYNTTASGQYSFAQGSGSVASGNQGFAFGNSAVSSGNTSASIGNNTTASGYDSIAMGYKVTSSANYSAAIGLGVVAGTAPTVSAQDSLGIFMGDQSGANLTAANTMAVLGGKVVIDPAVPSTTSSAATALQVKGSLTVGDGGETCGSTIAGGIRYTAGDLQYCDGTAWQTVSSTSGTGGVAAAGTTGQVQFNNGGVLGADANYFWDNTNKRLGIGTATPAYALDVAGDMRLSNNHFLYINDVSSAAERIIGLDSGNVLRVGSSSNALIGTIEFDMYSIANVMNIRSNGKIGFGSAPTAALDAQNAVVASGGVAYGTRLQQTLTAAANNDALYGLYINPAYTPGSFTGVTDYDLAFGGTAARTIAVLANGTSAGSGLTVKAGDTAGGTDISGGNLTLSAGQGTGAAGSNIIFEASVGGSSGTASNPPAEAMRVAANGDVGIAKTNPAYKLDVNGDIALSGKIYLSSGNLSPTITYSGGNYTSFTNFGGGFRFVDNSTYGSEFVTFVSPSVNSGIVGIKNTSPATALDVNGTVRVANGGETCGSTIAGGIRYTTGDLQYCDGTAWQTISSTSGTGGVAAAGSTGQVQFNNAGVLGADANYFWDNTNKRLGIGTSTPQYSLDLSQANAGIRLTNTVNGDSSLLEDTYGHLYLTHGGANVALIFGNSYIATQISGVAGPVQNVLDDGTGRMGVGSGFPTAGLDVQTAITAASGVAYGARLQQTLTAAANNDTLYGIYVNPTYTPGSYAGVTDYDLAFAGGASRIIAVMNNASSAGNGLTLRAGGTNGGTDIAGGDLILSGGQGTGAAGSNIIFKTAATGSSGGDVNTPTEAMRVDTAGNIAMTTGTSIITAAHSLELAQSGDSYGGTAIYLQNRQGAQHGMILQNSGLDLADLAFQGSSGNGLSLRYEHRGSELANYANDGTTGEFEFLDATGGGNGTVMMAIGRGNIVLAPTAFAGFLTNTANVGIGVNAPATKLDVAGTIRIADGGETCGSTVAGGLRYTTGDLQYCDGTAWQTVSSTSGTGGVAAAGTTGQVQFNNGGVLGADANYFWDNTNKRLGIGTSTPQDILHIYQNTANNLRPIIENGNSNYDAGLTLNTTSNHWGLASLGGLSASPGGFGLFDLSSLRLVMTSTGKLGIGSYPTMLAGLEVQVPVTADSGIAYGTRLQQTLTAAANNDTLYGLYINPTYTPGSYTGVKTFDLAFAGGHDRTIGVGLNASIAGSGLQVRAGGTSGGTDTAGGDLSLSGGQGTGAAGSNIVFKTSVAGSNGTTVNTPIETMRIASNGYVGIGTSNPTAALTVNGNINYTGVITSTSDIRLKTDIAPLDAADVLKRLARVKTYSFRYKTDLTGRLQYGVMAQEIENVFPELVVTANDGMRTKSVNYIGLIAPLVDASQTLKADNDNLRAQVADLKTHQMDTTRTLAQMQKDINGMKAQSGYGIGRADMTGMIAPGVIGAAGFAGGVAFRRRRRKGEKNEG